MTTLFGNVRLPSILKYFISKYLRFQVIMLQLKVIRLTTNLSSKPKGKSRDTKYLREAPPGPFLSFFHMVGAKLYIPTQIFKNDQLH